jgi:anti-sigma factor RsiW
MSDTRRFGWLRRLFGSRQAEVATEESGLACRELVELVTSYLDRTLPERDRLRFEAHLAVCPHCTEYLSQFRLTIRATGRLKEADLAPDAKEALLGAFRSWKAS